MNRNHHIKTAAVAISAGVIIGSTSMTSASPLAGTVASMYNVEESVVTTKSTLSGATFALSAIMEEAASEEVAVVTDITPISSGSQKETVETGAAPEEAVTDEDIEEASEAVTDAEETGEEEAEETPKSVAAVQETDFSNIAIANVNDYVNIRSEASEESEAVGKLYANGAATVQEVEGDWIHVTSGNAEGYIKAEFLEIGNEELCLENSKIIAKVQTDGLNVREEENTDSSILSRKGEGDRLNVSEEPAESEEWVKVDLDDGEGFVSAEFVEVSRVYGSVAETKEEEEARLEKERQEAAAKAAKSSGSGKSSGGGYAPPAGAGGQAVANFACQFIGNPYVYGGTSLTGGADCSGFVMSVYANFGVGLPHSSGAMRGVGYGVDPSQMAPGDILCYSGHVGIYVGGGQMVNASTAATGIKYTNVNYKPILAVRRIM